MNDTAGVPPAVVRRLMLSLVGFRWSSDGWWVWGGVRLSNETVDRLDAARWEAVLQLASGGVLQVWN